MTSTEKYRGVRLGYDVTSRAKHSTEKCTMHGRATLTHAFVDLLPQTFNHFRGSADTDPHTGPTPSGAATAIPEATESSHIRPDPFLLQPPIVSPSHLAPFSAQASASLRSSRRMCTAQSSSHPLKMAALLAVVFEYLQLPHTPIFALPCR